DANPVGLGLGTLDADVFADSGLVFAGFGSGFATPGDAASGPDGSGLVWPDGATSAQLDVEHPGGTATVVITPGAPLPTTLPGLGSWAEVTAFGVTFAGGPGGMPPGAAASVPYLVTTGTAATPRTYVDHVLATARLGAATSAP